MVHPSELCSLMPRQLTWCELEYNAWAFCSIKQDDELEYQRTISHIISAADSVVSSSPMVKLRMKSVFEKLRSPYISLFQFWVPIEVNGSTFLSTADQLFVINKQLDKRLCSYRRLCLDTLIPIDDYKEGLPGPPKRFFRRCLPEYNPDDAVKFPLLQTAIRSGIHSYYAIPLFNLHDRRYLGVFEIVSTETSLPHPRFFMGLNFKSVGFYTIFYSWLIPFGLSKPPVDHRLDEIRNGLYEILDIHSLPFAQIWIPYSRSGTSSVLYCADVPIYESFTFVDVEFDYDSEVYFIEHRKAFVGRAFASKGSCFCKDVTLLSIKEYSLVPSDRKARFAQSFAICLQSKCANNFVCVVEYLLPPNEMVVRDTKTFSSMLLSTMKEQFPGFIVAPGNELGQRMLVEVIKVSPSDELDSFEIQTVLSVQSLQDGGETTEIDSFRQQSNLQNGENNVAAALLVPSCSSDKLDSLNCERTVEVDPLLPHPIEEAVTNRGKVNLDAAHDDHIEDTPETMQLDSHFEQPNLEINSVGNAITNNEKIHSHKNKAIQRIEKDHGITRKILEQHFGMTLQDAAKNLSVSRATLKRICRENEIARWPHHKTRKVNVHVSQGVSFQGAEPYVVDQQCPALSKEKGTDYLGNKRSTATGKPCDSMMTLKVTYRGDIIKFQLSLPSTRVELEGEVEKRLNISLQRFSIKYQDEDDEWILITTDSDLRDGMHSLRLLGRTTMRLQVTPKAAT